MKTGIDFTEKKNRSRILIIINSVMELWLALLYKSEFLFLMLGSDPDVTNLFTANQAERAILGFHFKLFLVSPVFPLKLLLPPQSFMNLWHYLKRLSACRSNSPL